LDELWFNRTKIWAEFSTLGMAEPTSLALFAWQTKQPNLKLKTRPEQLLVSLPFDFALPGCGKTHDKSIKGRVRFNFANDLKLMPLIIGIFNQRKYERLN
jgi:hypothetical protein